MLREQIAQQIAVILGGLPDLLVRIRNQPGHESVKLFARWYATLLDVIIYLRNYALEVSDGFLIRAMGLCCATFIRSAAPAKGISLKKPALRVSAVGHERNLRTHTWGTIIREELKADYYTFPDGFRHQQHVRTKA